MEEDNHRATPLIDVMHPVTADGYKVRIKRERMLEKCAL
jgi:hypothetical protein